jgi:hypothetical protein
MLLIAHGLDEKVVSMEMKRMIFIRSVDPAPPHQPACRVNEPFGIRPGFAVDDPGFQFGFRRDGFRVTFLVPMAENEYTIGYRAGSRRIYNQCPESWLSIPVRLSSEAPVVVPQ